MNQHDQNVNEKVYDVWGGADWWYNTGTKFTYTNPRFRVDCTCAHT